MHGEQEQHDWRSVERGPFAKVLPPPDESVAASAGRRTPDFTGLPLLVAAVGDASVHQIPLDPTDPAFAAIPVRTWIDLGSAGDLRRIDGETDGREGDYTLTPIAWLRGLRANSSWRGARCGQRCDALQDALRPLLDQAKGEQSVAVAVPTLATIAGVPPGWLLNVCESQLLAARHPERDMRLGLETASGRPAVIGLREEEPLHVRVWATFGKTWPP
jgi:hypothetical protein